LISVGLSVEDAEQIARPLPVDNRPAPPEVNWAREGVNVVVAVDGLAMQRKD
jgi:hypothetical protein